MSEAKIRTVRKASGLSLREVARRINMTPTQLSKIETGKQNATLQRFYDIAVATGNTEVSDVLEPYVGYTLAPKVLEAIQEYRRSKEAEKSEGDQR